MQLAVAVSRLSAVDTACCKLLMPTLLCLLSGEIDNRKLRLGQTQQRFDTSLIRRVYSRRVNEVTLLLGSLLGQNV